MRIIEISSDECNQLLARTSLGRLACSFNDKPYVVPVSFAYQPNCLYIFSTAGKKIDWMRKNHNVCLQVDELGSRTSWSSVVVEGSYLELRGPEYLAEKEHAKEQLAEMTDWWQMALAERREKTDDLSIEPVFFRIDIESMSGLRAIP